MWVWKEYGLCEPSIQWAWWGGAWAVCTGGCWQLRVLGGIQRELRWVHREVGFYKTEGIGVFCRAVTSRLGLGKPVSCTTEVDGSQRGRSEFCGRPRTVPTREVAADSEADVERPGSVCDVLIGESAGFLHAHLGGDVTNEDMQRTLRSPGREVWP